MKNNCNNLVLQRNQKNLPQLVYWCCCPQSYLYSLNCRLKAYKCMLAFGWFLTHRLAASWSQTRKSVWVQMSLVRTLWWPSLMASLGWPTQLYQLEERRLSWITWCLKTCWMLTYLLSTCLGITDSRRLLSKTHSASHTGYSALAISAACS